MFTYLHRDRSLHALGHWQPEIRGDIITLLSQHFLLPSDEKLEVALY